MLVVIEAQTVFERAQLRIVHRRENLSTLSEYVADFKQVTTNRFLLPILSSYAPLEVAAFAIDLGLRVARIDGYEGQNWLDVMTNDISCTSLWRKAFIENRKDCSTAEQDFFRQHLEDMRERVKPLVARIMRDMPGVSSEEAARPNQEQAEQASLIPETSTTFDSRPLLLVFGRPDHQ